MKNNSVIVGHNLKVARRAKGLKQADIAKELHKRQQDISDYETGKIQLDYDKIIFFCQRYDITPNFLFDYD